MKIKYITKIALAAAVYVVLTLAVAPISYGPIQFRISEVLNLLAFIDPIYIAALTLGCAIANLFSSLGIIDVLVGSTATFIGAYLIHKTKNIYIASLWPILANVLVAAELYFLKIAPFWASVFGIGVSEFIIVTIIGVPIFKVILKNKALVDKLKVSK